VSDVEDILGEMDQLEWFVRVIFFFFSSRRRHTRFSRDWSSDVCSSDLADAWGDRRRITTAAARREQDRPARPRARRGASTAASRSEERRVGKECRCRGSPYPTKKNIVLDLDTVRGQVKYVISILYVIHG